MKGSQTNPSFLRFNRIVNENQEKKWHNFLDFSVRYGSKRVQMGGLVFVTPLNVKVPRLNEAMAPKGGTARRRFENGFA